MSDYPSDWPGFPESEDMLRAERANGDDQSRQARPTTDDRIVAFRGTSR